MKDNAKKLILGTKIVAITLAILSALSICVFVCLPYLASFPQFHIDAGSADSLAAYGVVVTAIVSCLSIVIASCALFISYRQNEIVNEQLKAQKLEHLKTSILQDIKGFEEKISKYKHYNYDGIEAFDRTALCVFDYSVWYEQDISYKAPETFKDEREPVRNDLKEKLIRRFKKYVGNYICYYYIDDIILILKEIIDSSLEKSTKERLITKIIHKIGVGLTVLIMLKMLQEQSRGSHIETYKTLLIEFQFLRYLELHKKWVEFFVNETKLPANAFYPS